MVLCAGPGVHEGSKLSPGRQLKEERQEGGAGGSKGALSIALLVGAP